ncbi:hypothetical protein RHSIM_RhsimUnG0002400 [Rhododendron simsii]|uniref:BED-type domain-containing protein n=1 Tax=Rhododendron simsii TaxID=118357 RepID=A0A834FZX6_RHOSS|nr:hypothetical protein RHSIM_RhsimUnG0002400 [Rhododendron simsii]
MSESPVGSSSHSTNSIDASGPSGPLQPTSSPLQSDSPLNNHTSEHVGEVVEILSDKVYDDDDNKRLRSPYWAHYNRVKLAGIYKAICKYCGDKINGETKNETSHLSQHYIRKHQKKDTMRYKINVLEFYFKLLFPTTYKEEVEKVHALCYKLLKEYQSPSAMMEGVSDSSSQLSSVEEESLSKLVSPHRSRLHPNTMEALMCAQSWLWAGEMKGESTSGYTTIYDDVETGDSS